MNIDANQPPAVHGCGAKDCTADATVQWMRRSADDPDSTDTVFACSSHGISLAAAAHVHQPACPGPNSTSLPGCGCTPEPLPAPEEPPPPPDLPPGW